MNITVKDLINNINETRTQISSSIKDETRVMKAMLNDPTFVVDVWSRNGVEKQYCPYEEARVMIANIIRDTTKVSAAEAEELAKSYDFGNQEANIMIGITKEFVNTYIETGRKLPLGGRELSNVALAKKIKKAKNNESKAYTSLKVYGSTPSWLK